MIADFQKNIKAKDTAIAALEEEKTLI